VTVSTRVLPLDRARDGHGWRAWNVLGVRGVEV